MKPLVPTPAPQPVASTNMMLFANNMPLEPSLHQAASSASIDEALFSSPPLNMPSSRDPGAAAFDLLDFSMPAPSQQSVGWLEMFQDVPEVVTASEQQARMANLSFAISRLGAPQRSYLLPPISEPSVNEVLLALEHRSTQPLYSVVNFKTKVKILSAAESLGDPDVLLTVVLFLRESLADAAFFNIMAQSIPARPPATEWVLPTAPYQPLSKGMKLYMLYLAETDQLQVLEDLYRRLVMHEDRALTQLRTALRAPTNQRVHALHMCAEQYIQNPATKSIGEHAQQARDLLDRQIKIDTYDAKVAEAGQEEIYVKFPRPCIIHATVANTLYYCSFYHSQAAPSKLSSPENFKNHFGVVEKIAAFQLLRVLSRKREWNLLKDMVEVKGMQGKMISMFKTLSTETKPVYRHSLGLKVFVEIIILQNGPIELMTELARAIEDPETRFKTLIQFADKEAYRKQIWILSAEALGELGHRNRLVALKDDVFASIKIEENEDLVIKFNEVLNKVISAQSSSLKNNSLTKFWKK
eukprot:c18900_g1_i2.p1 GENE.c18900_g1_i2~~c18900_g1_i2.p1  ORF type:complete len:556 (+),score=139.80 c18900_g1_i2:91-1668(+)